MNTELVLPEYGRNIQNMVEIAKRIEDRAERNRCARTIINCMGNLFPYLRDNESFRHKLWDHLALMANFELDIDYPFEINRTRAKDIRPDNIPLPQMRINELHYGRFTTELINLIVNNPNLANRQNLILMTANYMKRCYNTYNQDIADDMVIFNDLYRMSGGNIDLRHSGIRLNYIPYDRRKSYNNSNTNSKNIVNNRNRH